jgi:hypothetical protein
MRSLPHCQSTHPYHLHIRIENARTQSLKIYGAKNFQKQRVKLGGRSAACEGGTAQGLLEDLKWLPVLADLVRKPALAGDGVTVGGSSVGSALTLLTIKINISRQFLLHYARAYGVCVCVCAR